MTVSSESKYFKLIHIISCPSDDEMKSAQKRKRYSQPFQKNRDTEFEDTDDMKFNDNINFTAGKSNRFTTMTEGMRDSSTKISNDDFKSIKVIGRGSFGKVYLV